MRVDIGSNPTLYAAGILTVLASVYSFKTAVEIGTGPISLLIHLISVSLLIIGILLIGRAFKKAEMEFLDEQRKWERKRRENAQAQSSTNQTDSKVN